MVDMAIPQWCTWIIRLGYIPQHLVADPTAVMTPRKSVTNLGSRLTRSRRDTQPPTRHGHPGLQVHAQILLDQHVQFRQDSEAGLQAKAGTPQSEGLARFVAGC